MVRERVYALGEGKSAGACRAVPSRRARQGLTLLEVVLSLAIFLFSLAALVELVSLASARVLQAQYRQYALLLCQSKLAELAAGATPLSNQTDTPLDEDPDWHWSATCDNSLANGLWTVQVTVTGPVGSNNPVSVTLTRMLLDPTVRGNTQDTPASLSAANSSGGSSNSSSTGSAPAGGTTPASSGGN